MSRFSVQLIERLTRYFKDCYGIDLESDEADEFLASLSRVSQALSLDSTMKSSPVVSTQNPSSEVSSLL